MQVFKAFFKIINKNKVSVLVYVGIFFGLSLMLSGAGQKNDKTQFSQTSLKIALENRDQGKLGDGLLEYLSGKNEIKKIPEKREELLDAMYYEELDYVLVIPEDFSRLFMAGERDGLLEGTVTPGSTTASLAETEISQFLTTLAMYTDSGYQEAEAAERTLEIMQKDSKVEFLDAKVGKMPAVYYFQYLPYIFICVMIISLGVVLMAFGKKDMDARNKCSAMSFTNRNMQMVLGSIILMIMEYILFMGMAVILYPDYMMGIQGALSAANAFAFMLLSLGIAFLVGRLVKNMDALNMISNVLGLGFSFLGGIFVPLEFISEDVKKVSKFIPSYWYTISNESIQKIDSIQQAGPVIQNILVLLGFTAAILAAALVVNRMKARSV